MECQNTVLASEIQEQEVLQWFSGKVQWDDLVFHLSEFTHSLFLSWGTCQQSLKERLFVRVCLAKQVFKAPCFKLKDDFKAFQMRHTYKKVCFFKGRKCTYWYDCGEAVGWDACMSSILKVDYNKTEYLAGISFSKLPLSLASQDIACYSYSNIKSLNALLFSINLRKGKNNSAQWIPRNLLSFESAGHINFLKISKSLRICLLWIFCWKNMQLAFPPLGLEVYWVCRLEVSLKLNQTY